MSNLCLGDFAYIRMWPRDLFSQKENGRLLIKKMVPQLGCPGVYVLYKDEEPFYIGRASRLMSRLHSHANKVTAKHYAHWNYFSAFALEIEGQDSNQKLALIEAFLIASMPKTRNDSTPRFKRIQIPKSMR